MACDYAKLHKILNYTIFHVFFILVSKYIYCNSLKIRKVGRKAYFHFKDGKTQKARQGNSLGVQWLGLCTLTAEGPGSILGQGTKIPQAVLSGQKKKKKARQILLILKYIFCHSICSKANQKASAVGW